jgi:hypothetical protein
LFTKNWAEYVFRDANIKLFEILANLRNISTVKAVKFFVEKISIIWAKGGELLSPGVVTPSLGDHYGVPAKTTRVWCS